MAIGVTVAAGTSAHLNAQTQEIVPPERLAAREWYRDAKFGLFIHWGVYSLLGNGEWVMHNRGIRVPEYEWLASTFNPVRFDADEWVLLAKAAGMRYITITSRHHDGFSMFGSRQTGTTSSTGRRSAAILKELAEACRRHGLKLFFYYSQLDWRHPDYWPRGETGRSTGRADAGSWDRYLDFMDAQLEELLTGYGPLGGIWFDGMWDKPQAPWQLNRTYALIHRLQPAALIIPNHHKAPLPGEDVQTFEQDLPGANTAGFNTSEIGLLPLETSLTMNNSWGFNVTDRSFKSATQLIHYLVRAAGFGANLLLNVGPRPDGTIQPEAAERLREMGRWMDQFGSSIHGTRAGPITPRDWGVTTQRGDTIYVHVLNWPDRQLAIPALMSRIASARLMGSSEAVPFAQTSAGVTLTLPAADETPDRVIVLITGR
jgi:alpha-L-fucosidase